MTSLPPTAPPDWQDRHEGPLSGDRTGSARDVYEQGFHMMPGWATTALRMRNRIVRLFGLKTEGQGGADLMTSLPVVEDSADRYCVGLQDKHLTFTLLTERTARHVKITTSIWFNHWSGRAYLAVVLIPHKLILRHIIKGLA